MVIAHRLSTVRGVPSSSSISTSPTHSNTQVRRADMIVVMCEGKIVQTGTHDELMSRDDDDKEVGFVTYRSLVRRQVFDNGGR